MASTWIAIGVLLLAYAAFFFGAKWGRSCERWERQHEEQRRRMGQL